MSETALTKPREKLPSLRSSPGAHAAQLSHVSKPHAPHDHIIRFYEHEQFLIQSLDEFVRMGLQSNETCIVIAADYHIKRLQELLREHGLDVAAAVTAKRLIMTDARTMLDRIMAGDRPDSHAFLQEIGTLIANTTSNGQPVRVFSEMGSLLCIDRNLNAALQLENLWSELGRLYPFFLYCSCPLSAFNREEDSLPLEDIGSRHDRIIPGESYDPRANEKEHLQAIVKLQQKAEHLRHETRDRQAAEHALRVSEGALAQMSALTNAKDEFISLASHQLRTPATAVKQYLGMLLQGYEGELTPKQAERLQKAYESNERQIKIINELLLVARVDAGKVQLMKESCDLAALIRDVAAEQEGIIKQRRQSLTLRLPRSHAAIVDPRYIRMVIENLLSNASKYSPAERPITVSLTRRDKQTYIKVHDKGIGIAPADQTRLYQKFSRIYNSFSAAVEGTGLGLYWSKKIVELHNGRLELSSQPGKGSTFTIVLP